MKRKKYSELTTKTLKAVVRSQIIYKRLGTAAQELRKRGYSVGLKTGIRKKRGKKK